MGAWWRRAREVELADRNRAVGGGAAAEFGPAEQAGGFGVDRGGDDLAGRADLAELAVVDDGKVVTDAQSLVAVVGHVHGGDVEGGQEL